MRGYLRISLDQFVEIAAERAPCKIALHVDHHVLKMGGVRPFLMVVWLALTLIINARDTTRL